MDQAIRETATRLRIGIGAFKRRTEETLAEGDLTVPQLGALSRLDRRGPATTAQLARWQQITPQAMGATHAELAKRGTTPCIPPPRNRRVQLRDKLPHATDVPGAILHLPPPARAGGGEGRGSIVDRVAGVLAEQFTADEITTLDAAARLIERLAEQL